MKTLVLSIALTALTSHSLLAELVFIENPSFETPVLSPSTTIRIGQPLAGWTTIDAAGKIELPAGAGFVPGLTATPPDGIAAGLAGFNGVDSALIQDLSPWGTAKLFSFSGQVAGTNGGNFTVELLRDGTPFGSLSGAAGPAAFTPFNLVFDGRNSATHGSLSIRLRSTSGSTVVFDTIALDAVPEPSTALLFVGATSAAFFYSRRRRKTSQSDN